MRGRRAALLTLASTALAVPAPAAARVADRDPATVGQQALLAAED